MSYPSRPMHDYARPSTRKISLPCADDILSIAPLCEYDAFSYSTTRVAHLLACAKARPRRARCERR